MTDQPSVLSPSAEQNKPRHFWFLALLLSTHAATFLAQLPTIYEFANFVFFDPGVTLRTDKLLAQGYVPTVDFGYPYSLLPLILGRVFFALASRTPAAYILFMFLTEAAILAGLWRLARQDGWLIAAFVIAAMPHAIIPVYVHLTHPLEAALIVHTIADLAAGRRARALALATACLFVKPSMAYVLGFLIIVLAIVHLVRQRDHWKSFFPFLRPAIITGAACLTISSVYFGLVPTVSALIPTNGAQSYKALGFGFFGNGRTFWLPKLGSAAQFAKYYSNDFAAEAAEQPNRKTRNHRHRSRLSLRLSLYVFRLAGVVDILFVIAGGRYDFGAKDLSRSPGVDCTDYSDCIGWQL